MQLAKPAYIVRCRRSGRVIHTQDLARVAKFCRANEACAGADNYTISRLPVHAVVAEKMRVIFPDNEEGRPFSFFSVYVSPGIPVFGGTAKRIVYSRLGRPINNNTSRVVEFDLNTTGLLPATG